VCLGKPRPFVRIESWAGSHAVCVEVLARTPKRWRVRFLENNQKGKRGDIRWVAPNAVFAPSSGGESKE